METQSGIEIALGDGAREGAGLNAPTPGSGDQGALGPALALTVALAVGFLFTLAPIARSLLPVTELPAPLSNHHQHAETLLFVVAYGLLLPAAVLIVPGIVDRVARADGVQALSALAALLCLGLAVAALIIRAIGGDAVLAAAMGIWSVSASALLAAVATGHAHLPVGISTRARGVWLAAGAASLGLAVSFTDIASIAFWPLIAGVVAAGVVAIGWDRFTLPRLHRGWALALDALMLLILFLAVPNLVVFTPGDPSAALQTDVVHFHQDFFLGPANQVLGGGAMLVDTLSQYGVASIYFLVGWFELVPIGNGTLGLIEGLLSALTFCGGYVVLRIAGVSRVVAGAAMAVAVVVCVYGLLYPLGALLQHGAFRFGLPIGFLIGAVAEERWPRAKAPARFLQLGTVALASIWALEAFAYTALTAAAIIAMRVSMAAAGERIAMAVRQAAALAAVCVAAHISFAAATLIFTGDLPDWGWYLATLREFLTGPVGDVTYDFSPWSPGLAIGIIYLASAAALLLVLKRRVEMVERDGPLLIAIGGTTAYGVALLSYLVNRSADHIVPYVSLPVFMLAALWTAAMMRPSLAIAISIRRWAVFAVVAGAALVVSVAWSSVGLRWSQSALALALPGGSSLDASLSRLWNPPPLNDAAPEGVRLLDRYMPAESRSIVLADSDLGIEILTRAKRTSLLPLGDPDEDSLVPSGHLGPLGAAVDDLQPGTRVLIDHNARQAYRVLTEDPARDPIENPVGRRSYALDGVASLPQWALQRIGLRYRLRTVARGRHGLEVVELVPRSKP